MRFSQVDVFSSQPLRGNPVAVVHDADGVTDEQMAAFARWTNLSETTFLLAPTQAGADYRLRIWTPGGELPFAGHPTLGSAHAWLEAGGVPATDGELVQECGAGLVRLRRGTTLAFAAPPLIRSGPVDDADLDAIVRALRVRRDDLLEAAWIDNGPGWVGVLLADAETVLGLRPDWAAFGDRQIGVVGRHAADGPADVEVRAFCPDLGIPEDPVTGSLNAGIGQWLAGSRLPSAYVASQGTALLRAGRVHVVKEGQTVWVGGDTRTTISGSVDL
ncbi:MULTISPECIES: PhzF family phenazine biosynthesis protein [unclassified Nocardioides]|uniref:PhzF family phenazine biosynthesis protein n=1 Tax=unclassified Nocardioides TaxID=2615069 RepID=UPI00005701BD|nr:MULTISPECIES: PhzF family phenazine biosynthesis protein [unclassified Nocardioides]ABL81815.1 phenazine biosynthesis protein PhzF family [Nocardioides sp. JS614]